MNRYDVFIRIVETGSFTQAAAESGYTQSAVSQMIRTLEHELTAGNICLTYSQSAMPDVN